MSKKSFFFTRKRSIAALSIALSATLSLGLLSACGGEETPTEDEEPTVSTATDTQLLKNGNFEFYDERDTKLEDKRTFISTPTSWSFSSGSPSSNARSGLIETESEEWKQITSPGSKNLSTFDRTQSGGETKQVTTFASIDDAVAHWEDDDVTVYDRLYFLDTFKSEVDKLEDGSEAKTLFDKYNYTIDFEDVDDLSKQFGKKGLDLHEGHAEDETAVLMIHNMRTSDGVMGTAQYYTSSTTITLEAGSAAEVSVWVRTDRLFHYYSEKNPDDKKELEKRGGAYIGIINSLGGNTQDEMQIKNINTKGKWQQYTVYIRANTYATTTFRIKLGLGQGTSSDNRYEAVDGYAFFDDVTVKKISSDAYDKGVENLDTSVKCDLNSVGDQKIFDQDVVKKEDGSYKSTYALDMLAEHEMESLTTPPTFGLTEEVSGSITYKSVIKDNSAKGNSTGNPVPDEDKDETPAAEDAQNVVGVKTFDELTALAGTNKFFSNIYENDFENKFPFGGSAQNSVNVILLLSTNGAAYTAKLENDTAFTLNKDQYLLISFFVKTSAMRSGISGAGVTLVDGENETVISPFDTTTVDPVTIDDSNEELTDIYKGWVQCFFFVSNTTDGEKTFSLKFTYGPTSVAGTKATDYCDGYAAFADLRCATLTKAQYGYASTGNYAKKVELTEYTKDTSKFADAEASSDIENGLATPAAFRGVVAGSKQLGGEEAKETPEGIYSGLLNAEHKGNYYGLSTAEAGNEWKSALDTIAGTTTTAEEWWGNLFGDKNNSAYPNRQPFVLLNASGANQPSYGIVSSTLKTTISSGSAQRITVRVKVKAGMSAFIYLLDTSDLSKGFNNLLTPTLPQYTYWYDADGNVVKSDPTEKGFKKKTDTLFYLETNGLYTRADKADSNYYANLKNYDKDEENNLVTSDGQIAFYGQEENGKVVYYAYRTFANGAYSYSQRVYDFTEAQGVEAEKYLRYNEANTDLSAYKAVIEVKGTEQTEESWTTVSFYVRAGSEAKTYRLELWAGARDNATDGFISGGYVFFDAYSSASSSNFDTLRDNAVDTLLDTEANRLEGDAEKVNKSLGLYYTFTFYDAKSFLRHDRTLDEVDLGSKWGSYDQTTKDEQLMWLKYVDDGETSGTPEIAMFLDYSAAEVSVTPDALDTDTDTDTSTDDEEEPSDTNIWLVLSSSLLAFVTLFAIGAVAFRAIRKRSKKNGPKPPKSKKSRPAAPAPAPEKPQEKKGIDPYDE